MQFWNVIDWRGVEREIQADSQAKAEEWAQEQYNEYCSDEGIKSNEDEIVLVCYEQGEEDDEARKVVEKSATVEYEYEASDFDQHNTYY